MTRKNRILLLLAIPALLTTAGCKSEYMLRDPQRFHACASGQSDDQARSFKAIKWTMANTRGYTINKIDEQNSKLDVNVCGGGHGYCIPLNVTVAKNGEVDILRDPGKEISGSGADLLEGWMKHLRANYERARCNQF